MRRATALVLAGYPLVVLAADDRADPASAEACSGDPVDFLIGSDDTVTFAASDSGNVSFILQRQADASWCIQDHPEVTVRCRTNDGAPLLRR